MEIKQGLKYTKAHDWVQVIESRAKIGISDYAQQQLTDIVYVELPEKGTKLKKGQPMGVIESVKAVEDLYAPISGTVIAKNQEVIDNPEILNTDPYKTWLVEMEIEDIKELDQLMTDVQYKEFLSGQE